MKRNKKNLPPILYVEDDQISREVVFMFLKNDFNIDHAGDSSEAMQKIKKNQYAAVLMDINLCEGLGGMELAKEIRRFGPYKNVPIIAVTANAFSEDKKKILTGGCSHYISKPFTKKSLLSVVQEAIKD